MTISQSLHTVLHPRLACSLVNAQGQMRFPLQIHMLPLDSSGGCSWPSHPSAPRPPLAKLDQEINPCSQTSHDESVLWWNWYTTDRQGGTAERALASESNQIGSWLFFLHFLVVDTFGPINSLDSSFLINKMGKTIWKVGSLAHAPQYRFAFLIVWKDDIISFFNLLFFKNFSLRFKKKKSKLCTVAKVLSLPSLTASLPSP